MKQGSLRAAAKMAATWVPAILLVLIFVPQGYAKFSDSSGWATAFRHWGYPVWFRMAIGGVELLAAACLLWARTAAIGAAMIIGVMLGGMATHLIHDGGRHMTSELGPLIFATIVLALRWGQVRRFGSSRVLSG